MKKWFIKSFLCNLLLVVLCLGFVAFLIWLANIGFWWISLIIVGLILIALYTLWKGPSINDFYFDDDGHLHVP